MTWIPEFLRRKRVEPKPIIEQVEIQNGFCFAQENGVQVEVLELPEMKTEDFTRSVRRQFLHMTFGEVLTDSDHIFSPSFEILESGCYSERYGLITTELNPCSFVIAATKKGVYLYHWLTLNGMSSRSKLENNFNSSLGGEDEELTIYFGPGSGKFGIEEKEISAMLGEIFGKKPNVKKIIQISPPKSKDVDPPVNVAVTLPINGKVIIIISRKKVENFQPKEL